MTIRKVTFLLLNLALLGLLVKLGFWQLQRAHEKEQLLSALESQQQKKAISNHQLTALPTEELTNRHAALTGELDFQHAFLLDNKVFNGRVGYQVLVPLMLGKSQILVNLGWLSQGKSRQELPVIPPLPGKLTIEGKLSSVNVGFHLGKTEPEQGWPNRVQEIDFNEMEQRLGTSLLPLVLLLDEDLKFGFPRKWQAVVMPPEKHLGYALQWFSMALVLIVIFGYFWFRGWRNETV